MAYAARARGIPEERWVHWWGGAHAAEEPWFLSERPSLTRSPALRASVSTALARAHLELDAVDFFDFYSCFPVAVSVACEMSFEAPVVGSPNTSSSAMRPPMAYASESSNSLRLLE